MVSSYHIYIVYCWPFLSATVSAFIDPESFPQVCLKIVCGMYTKRTYGFNPHTGMCIFVVRVPVGCSDLFASIDWFDWSIISFKLFVQAFFYWLLTCVYHMYWISVHWSWNLYLGVLANHQWTISKLDICICFYHRLVEDLSSSIHWLASRQ